MSLKLIRFITILFASSLLSACASFVTPAGRSANNETMSWQARKTQLNRIHAWRISGAVAIKTKQQAFTASLNWRQRNYANFKIYLFGPLGMGAVTLFGAPSNVVLHANNQKYTAQSASQLLQQQLGWQLPVNNLYYWVRGLPAPGSVNRIRYDRFHHITYLNQRGWRIHYLQYTGVGRYDLPSKIYLQNRYMSGRLIISRWTIGS